MPGAKKRVRRAENFRALSPIWKLDEIEGSERGKKKSAWRKKWDERPKKKRIMLLSNPFLHSAEHSAAELEWMREVYRKDIEGAHRHKNSLLVISSGAALAQSLDKETLALLSQLKKENRLVEANCIDEAKIPPKFMEGERELVARGERMHMCAPYDTGALARMLKLGINDVKMEMRGSYLYDEFEATRKPAADRNIALQQFLQGYCPRRYDYPVTGSAAEERLNKDMKRYSSRWSKIFPIGKEKRRLAKERKLERFA